MFLLNSGKILSLQNVLHALGICQNHIFADLLNSAGVRVNFNSRKAIHAEGSEFVAKGFCNGRFFVLDFVAENKMNPFITYIAKFISSWHARLGHVNIASIKGLD